MKFIKYTDNAKIEKYVNDLEVITFIRTRNNIEMQRSRHAGRCKVVQDLLNAGYTKATRTKAGA